MSRTTNLTELRRELSRVLREPFFRRIGSSRPIAYSAANVLADTALGRFDVSEGWPYAFAYVPATGDQREIVDFLSDGNIGYAYVSPDWSTTPGVGAQYEIHSIWSAQEKTDALNHAVHDCWPAFYEVLTDESIVIQKWKKEYSLLNLSNHTRHIMGVYIEPMWKVSQGIVDDVGVALVHTTIANTPSSAPSSGDTYSNLVVVAGSPNDTVTFDTHTNVVPGSFSVFVNTSPLGSDGTASDDGNGVIVDNALTAIGAINYETGEVSFVWPDFFSLEPPSYQYDGPTSAGILSVSATLSSPTGSYILIDETIGMVYNISQFAGAHDVLVSGAITSSVGNDCYILRAPALAVSPQAGTLATHGGVLILPAGISFTRESGKTYEVAVYYGTGSGQFRELSDIACDSEGFYLDSPWTTALDSTSEFCIKNISDQAYNWQGPIARYRVDSPESPTMLALHWDATEYWGAKLRVIFATEIDELRYEADTVPDQCADFLIHMAAYHLWLGNIGRGPQFETKTAEKLAQQNKQDAEELRERNRMKRLNGTVRLELDNYGPAMREKPFSR